MAEEVKTTPVVRPRFVLEEHECNGECHHEEEHNHEEMQMPEMPVIPWL